MDSIAKVAHDAYTTTLKSMGGVIVEVFTYVVPIFTVGYFCFQMYESYLRIQALKTSAKADKVKKEA